MNGAATSWPKLITSKNVEFPGGDGIDGMVPGIACRGVVLGLVQIGGVSGLFPSWSSVSRVGQSSWCRAGLHPLGQQVVVLLVVRQAVPLVDPMRWIWECCRPGVRPELVFLLIHPAPLGWLPLGVFLLGAPRNSLDGWALQRV